ncbi:MAG TPA: hypothetical protein PK926_15340 [Spirochaetota bacterium]|nr:hypothetical protein [Spirochaetota bacterium]HPI91352.1 hypothetical protein [Spirochaetota bacterium]HPR49435.1 hypothetical protein [Spirochaetota bacterium]
MNICRITSFKIYFAMVLAALVMAVPLYAQDASQPDRLAQVASAIDSYQGKTLTMTLRLKTRDTVFEKIAFYDRKNHDLVFDISSRETKKRLKKYMATIHEGMEYRVTFTVLKLDNSGMIMAELVEFIPVILEHFP